MGEVVFTSGETIFIERSQNDDCVSCLEGLLEKARNGEITGVCVALQYGDRSTSTAIGGFIWNTPMIGRMTQMIHTLVTR